MAASLRFVPMLALQFLLFTSLAQGQAIPSDAQRQPLGSLTSTGEVYVDDARAPSDLTIFSGESLRTGGTGTALFTTATGSSYQISPGSAVIFAGDPRYAAELKSGTIFVKSTSGPGRAVVRVGNFVVVPTILNSQTVEKIEGMGDGSFLITCTIGNIGIIPMQGAPGLFLEAGQSATITAKNELVGMQQPAQGTPGSSSSPSQNQAAGRAAARSYRPLIYLGLAGGGAAAVAVLIANRSHPVVSPSSP